MTLGAANSQNPLVVLVNAVQVHCCLNTLKGKKYGLVVRVCAKSWQTGVLVLALPSSFPVSLSRPLPQLPIYKHGLMHCLHSQGGREGKHSNNYEVFQYYSTGSYQVPWDRYILLLGEGEITLIFICVTELQQQLQS